MIRVSFQQLTRIGSPGALEGRLLHVAWTRTGRLGMVCQRGQDAKGETGYRTLSNWEWDVGHTPEL